jgi:probable addiction module antidote protein
MSKGRIPAAVPARPYVLERLRDPQTAAAYLSAAAAEDDPGAFLQALRNVTEARGGISKIAARTGLNRQQLYKTLSRQGNPELRSLTKILEAAGLQFVVAARPVRTTRSSKRRAKASPDRVAA